jgi:hypothetical protein
MNENAAERIRRADAFLANTSWDDTWRRIDQLLEEVIQTSTVEIEADVEIGALAREEPPEAGTTYV